MFLENRAVSDKNQSIIEHTFTLGMIIEKSREYKGSVYYGFSEILKPYDSVGGRLSYKVVRRYAITEKLIHLSKLTYKNTLHQELELMSNYQVRLKLGYNKIITPLQSYLTFFSM